MQHWEKSWKSLKCQDAILQNEIRGTFYPTPNVKGAFKKIYNAPENLHAVSLVEMLRKCVRF